MIANPANAKGALIRSECEDLEVLSDDASLKEEAPESFRRILVEETDEDDGWKGAPFDPNLIDIGSQTQSLSNVVSQIDENEIDLSPAFQRYANLWDETRQSRLIESILLRIPLPAFYFDAEDIKDDTLGVRRSIWHVIDGLQRLCAIRKFVAKTTPDNEKLRLRDLEFLHNLEGHSFDELARPYQRIINETQLTVYLVKSRTPPNVKFNIFKRVNTGGMPLTQQEIRHALNQGVAADFLKELAESPAFKESTCNRIKPYRMLDREFVNRFLAFFLIERGEDEDMDAYYCRALDVVAKLSIQSRDEIRSAFCDALNIMHLLFGKWAYCKLDRYPRVKPINKVLFEVMTVTLAKTSPTDRKRLSSLKDSSAMEEYRKLLSGESEFLDLISVHTGSAGRVQRRYTIARNFFKTLLEKLP